MNKNQFMEELKYKLRNLPQDELDNVLNYYEEYFEDAQVDACTNVESELGSPSKVAAQILSDYATKDLTVEYSSRNFSFSSIWFIILAILASPIALPLGFALIVVIASLVFAMATLVVSLGSCAVAIILAGIAVISSAFGVITTSFATFILFVGLGFTLCGIGILALVCVFTLGSNSLKLIVKFSSKYLNKLNKRYKRKEI